MSLVLSIFFVSAIAKCNIHAKVKVFDWQRFLSLTACPSITSRIGISYETATKLHIAIQLISRVDGNGQQFAY